MRRTVAMAVVLVGCGPGDASTSCEIGSGHGEFEPLQEGDDVAIVAGPQGGHHVFTSVRCQGFGEQSISLSGGIRHLSTDQWLGPGFGFDTRVEPVQGEFEVNGLLNLVSDPELARDEEVLLTVEVQGDEGVARDERVVVAR